MGREPKIVTKEYFIRKLIHREYDTIFLWGASSSGARALSNLVELGFSAESVKFIDSNFALLQNKSYPVMDPEVLKLPENANSLVLITSTISYEIWNSVPGEYKGEVLYVHDMLFSRRRAWHYPSAFMEVLDKVGSFLNLDIEEAFALWNGVKDTKQIVGDIVEVGVYKGGSLEVISTAVKEYIPSKRIFGFDTFQGIPSFGNESDKQYTGYLNDTNYKEVKSNFAHDVNISVIQGSFGKGSLGNHSREVSFAHLDVDTYESTKHCLEEIEKYLVGSGRILIHDYNSLGCPGVKQAVDEFINIKDWYRVELNECQILLIKK